MFLPIGVLPLSVYREKPVAVLFGDESFNVKSWREVYTAILRRCNDNPVYHEKLMCLRDKVLGKVRVFISGSPDSMTRPVKIDENLYGETHYGSATLIHILVDRIMVPVGFDCYNISLVLKTRYK